MPACTMKSVRLCHVCCAVMSHAGLYHEVSGGDEPTELEAKEGGHINSQAGLFHSVGGQRGRSH